MSKLLLIDGSGYIYRSFYAMPTLNRSDGENVGAVFGFTNMMISIISHNSCEHLAIVLDKSKKNFRHDIYKEYKQNRKETPKELISQFSIVRDACRAFNLNVLEEEGFEADDLIAAYTKQAVNEGFNVRIISADKDLSQLISETVELYDPMKSKIITKEIVFEKYGVYPEKIRDFLALSGDSSDNIPGVKSVGPKTAANLLNEFGSLNGIYENLEKISKTKLKENLINCKEDAYLSQKLATLETNIPNLKKISELRIKKLNHEKIISFIEKQEFSSLTKKIAKLDFSKGKEADFNEQDEKIHETKELQNITQKNIFETENFEKIIDDAIQKKYIIILQNAILTENFKYNFGYEDFLKNIAEISNHENLKQQTNLFELQKNVENHKKIQHEKISEENISRLISLLENREILKITDDAKKILYLNENLENFDDISIIAFILGINPPNEINFETFRKIKNEMHSLNLTNYYESFEKKFIKIIYEIEKIGIKVDIKKLLNLKIDFEKKIKNLEEKIFETAGMKFNVASTKQLGDVLFRELKLPILKTNKKSGNYATNQETLEELSMQGYNIADYILEWRQISKLYSTYTDSLIKKVNQKTGRIHTNFNIIGTSTGRLSSSDPNLQNIPIKTEIGKQIRDAFIVPDGKMMISCDYSQIELRVLAEITNATFFLEAFHKNLDIHKFTASQIFKIPFENVTDELRRKAKAINFGIIYGMQSFGLAKRVNMSNHEANQFIKHYFEINHEILTYIEEIKKFAAKHGYVETLLKRRCKIQNASSKNYMVRKAAERQAINAPVQGTSADILQYAMIKISENENINAKIIMQIHDELLFEVDEEIAYEESKKIVEIMENINFIKTPLKVNSKIGKTWAEIH